MFSLSLRESALPSPQLLGKDSEHAPPPSLGPSFSLSPSQTLWVFPLVLTTGLRSCVMLIEGVEFSWLAGHWLNINFGPGGDKPVLLLTLAVRSPSPSTRQVFLSNTKGKMTPVPGNAWNIWHHVQGMTDICTKG